MLNNTDGVAFASPAVPNDPTNPEAVLWQVIAETAPQDEATSDLLTTLRDGSIDEASGIDLLTTGSLAVGADFSSFLADRIPIFFAAVLALSFLLLMACLLYTSPSPRD